ncbi:MAG: NUDIX domain-containing protein [Cellvibrionaceae bacterium]|nr:NUDIX domain-containing protein [Cellvibrionaceae bacterium]
MSANEFTLHVDGEHNLPEKFIPSLSIDNLIFGLQHGELNILLIKHSEGIKSGSWALPGGWIRYDEAIRDAAIRLLKDLTGLNNLYLEQLKTFGKVDRVSACRIVTIAYYALVSADSYAVVAGKFAAEAGWFPVSKMPSLVYDHREIVDFGLERLRRKVRHEPVGFNLLPDKFTLLQLQELYEAILNIKLDKPNFRRKILKMNLLIPCDEKQRGVAHRAANLYRFYPETYKKLTEGGFAFEI